MRALYRISGFLHLGGLSGPQQVGRHSTTVSKLGSKKKGMEYLSAAPSVTTLCTVDLKRPLVHLHTTQKAKPSGSCQNKLGATMDSTWAHRKAAYSSIMHLPSRVCHHGCICLFCLAQVTAAQLRPIGAISLFLLPGVLRVAGTFPACRPG